MLRCDAEQDGDAEDGDDIQFARHPGRLRPGHRAPETHLPADLQKHEEQADRHQPGAGELRRRKPQGVFGGGLGRYGEGGQPGSEHEAAADAAEHPVHRGAPVPESLQLADQRVCRIGQPVVGQVGCFRFPARYGRGGIEIFDLRIGAEFLVHLKRRVVAHELRDVAVRVVVIAEGDRRRDAGGRAGRGRVGIEAGRQAGSEPAVHPVHAEGAFLGDADPAVVEHGLFLARDLTVVVALEFVGDGAGLVGAGDRAIAAADAHIVVHRHQPVFALAGRAGRADRDAGRLGAMLAAGDEELALDVGVFALLDIDHPPPLDVGQRVVPVLAGDRAGLAADAAVDVDRHAPARGVGRVVAEGVSHD